MLTFALPTEKHFFSSFILDIIKCLCLSNQGKLEKTKPPKVLLMQGYLSKVKLDNHLHCFNSIKKEMYS